MRAHVFRFTLRPRVYEMSQGGDTSGGGESFREQEWSLYFQRAYMPLYGAAIRVLWKITEPATNIAVIAERT